LPLVLYMNGRARGGLTAIGAGGLLGMLCGLAFVALASSREFPLAGLLFVALGSGVVGAPAVIWARSRQRHISIAPYGPPER
jgi:hypothetical protein